MWLRIVCDPSPLRVNVVNFVNPSRWRTAVVIVMHTPIAGSVAVRMRVLSVLPANEGLNVPPGEGITIADAWPCPKATCRTTARHYSGDLD